MKARIPVFAKIALPLILIITLSVGWSGYRVYQASTQRWQSEMDRRLQRVALFVARSVPVETLRKIQVPRDIDSPEYLQIQQQLDQAMTAGNLTWIGIYYRKGGRLFYWVDQGYTGVGYPFFYATPAHLAAFEDGQPHRVQYTDEFGSYYGFVAPIIVEEEDGPAIGLVEAVLDRESSQLLEQRTWSQILPILIGGIGVAILLSILSTVLVFHRPLQQLQHGASELSAGRFGHAVPLRSNDELGDLAATFNRMSVELGRLYGQLRDNNRELESRVHGRTAELRAERNRLNTILQNIADGLVVTDLDGAILLANPTFGRIVHRPLDQVWGSPLSEVLPIQGLGDLVSQALIDTDTVRTASLPWKKATYKVSACALVEHAQDGPDAPEQAAASLGAVTVLRDVTAEAEVDRMKTDFISMVSHELRTPLTSVLGFAKLISRSFERTVLPAMSAQDEQSQKAAQRIRENLDIIVGEGERLTRLINDVLDIAKIEAGKTEWHMGSIEMREVIQGAVAATASLAGEKRLPVRVEIEPGMPPVHADRDRLIQVVTNLLSNAIKFTDQGEITVSGFQFQVPGSAPQPAHLPSWTSTLQPGGWLAVRVQDSGVGIATDDLPRLFQKFQQVGDPTNRPRRSSAQGTGLGLAICKEIVEHHGGHIGVESEIGVGSTFTFALPALLAPPLVSEEIRRRVAEALPALAPADRRPLSILVVDDEENIRQLLRQILAEAGYEVVEAANGVEALQKARQSPPDLIVLDLMMPVLSGFDVISALRNDPETVQIPIMILSVLEDREKGLKLGADAYLNKPLDTDGVLATVEKLLARSARGQGHKKVLIVDEDASTVEAISSVLREKGYEVVGAYNGPDGLAKALQERPHLIILDALISQSNDYEVLRSLKYAQETQQAYIILMSVISPLHDAPATAQQRPGS